MEPMDLKETIDFLVKGAEGKVPNLTDEEAKEFEAKALKVIVESSNDLVKESNEFYELGDSFLFT